MPETGRPGSGRPRPPDRDSVVKALGPKGEPGLVATYRHTAGDYLRAALRRGCRFDAARNPRDLPGTVVTSAS
jgi:hypothetical protein